MSCYALPVTVVPELIKRSRRTKLCLTFAGYPKVDTDIVPQLSALRKIWLSHAVRVQVRELEILDCKSRWTPRQWATLLCAPMPSLEELTIFLQSHGRIADIILSDDMLGSTIPIGLHSISLYNCMMPWSSPLLTANIRLLDLSNEDLPDTAALPSPSLFHDVLSRLTVLEELTLMNIFPVFNDNDNQPITTNLPESLRNVELSATILPMVTPCLKAFLSLATSRSAGYNVNICAVADDALISKALTHLFQSAPDPPTELHITCNSFSTLLPPEWSAGDPEVGLEWLNSESETDCCLERRFTLEDNESDTLSSLFRSPFSSAV